MSYARLYLVRHAESEGNAGHIMQGAGEYPLSTNGRLQARNATAALQALNPTLVVASDLGRAVETAMTIFGRIDHQDARLRERGAGQWEGRPRSDLEAIHPGALENDALRPDGFEPIQDVVERMRSATRDLLDGNAIVVAFTHGAVMRALDKDLGGDGKRFDHLEALIIEAGPVIVGRQHFAIKGTSV